MPLLSNLRKNNSNKRIISEVQQDFLLRFYHIHFSHQTYRRKSDNHSKRTSYSLIENTRAEITSVSYIFKRRHYSF
ncbi:hypothetical protein NPIL_238871 [Nephila pilipes]|uniref:Uncharacterized protein n=1 Tax=Nephila pilipes TaxID=299642 RepID=A0A8X6NMA6_NEPPI|nr:hypothetical protein NPIL_492101 [Nephila pilipes]GFT20463.1 hypothetical protein NPIL_238871 [Nephila pilipes]